MIDGYGEHENCEAFKKYESLPIYSDDRYYDISPDQRRFYEEESLSYLFEGKRDYLEEINVCEDCQNNLKDAYTELKKIFYVKPQGHSSRTKFRRSFKEIFQYSIKEEKVKKISLQETGKDSEGISKAGVNKRGESYFKFEWNEYLGRYNFYLTIKTEVKIKGKLFIIKDEINKRYYYESISTVNNDNNTLVTFNQFEQIGKGKYLNEDY